jgi:hypothetical protein
VKKATLRPRTGCAGRGGGLGHNVHCRRLDLGEEDVGLLGGARHVRRQLAAVGEAGRHQDDVGAVVVGERPREARNGALGRRREEGHPAAADGLRRPRPEHRLHDPQTGLDGRHRGDQGSHPGAIHKGRLALRQHERVAEEQPVGAEIAGDVLERLSGAGYADRGVAGHGRHHRAAALEHGQRRPAGGDERQRFAHVVVARRAGQAAAAAAAADGGHPRQDGVLVAIAGGVATVA